jgi:hypothetical protein
MKTSILLMLLVLFYSTNAINVTAAPARPADFQVSLCNGGVANVWANHESDLRRGWANVGGPGKPFPAGSYQCSIPAMNQCNLWDWMRQTTGIVLSNPSDPATSRNEIATYFINNMPEMLDPDYGLNCSIAQADSLGVTLTAPSESPNILTFYNYSGYQYSWVW